MSVCSKQLFLNCFISLSRQTKSCYTWLAQILWNRAGGSWAGSLLVNVPPRRGCNGGTPRGDVEEVPHPPNRSDSFGRHERWRKRELVSSPESAFYRLHDLV